MFYQIKREFVEYDEFQSHEKAAYRFKETLCSFENDSKDLFLTLSCTFCFFKLSEYNNINKEKVEEVLGKTFFWWFSKEKENIAVGSFIWKCF